MTGVLRCMRARACNMQSHKDAAGNVPHQSGVSDEWLTDNQ